MTRIDDLIKRLEEIKSQYGNMVVCVDREAQYDECEFTSEVTLDKYTLVIEKKDWCTDETLPKNFLLIY